MRNPTSLLEYEMKEKTITCNQCGKPFILTGSQQERISALGFDEPKRCPDCREKKITAGLSHHEEKMSHKNVDPERQWEFMYDIRKKRDALIVSGNHSKSSFKYLRLISMMEDDDDQ
jgi:NAD-dependent SIR2 family protein deacetylase